MLEMVMQVKVRDKVYPSVRAAAEALGVTVNAVYSALNRGNIDKLGLGKARKKPVDVYGVLFLSMTAAALALNFKRGYLSNALRRGSVRGLKRIEAAVQAYKERME